uniref:Xanthine dehydrogenase large subunit n=1 Tax=Candidatus Kentrum sp. FM TaxID=2126340 RepID=A0A450S4N3_9GAMM|nr:MAG: xanthine dehydrogenase large subunit [Candidatus Kentron sp. FM]VFJ47775.1 MAG: xanthine dehydrogenase large subunit [Candidatus Kentron sp. FM]VFK07953.1 MAG: xanthine dehydrogenase large subunit [Candidatus Kentron sp. FM]
MKNIDTELHVRGKSRFLDDLPAPEGALHAAVFASPIAHGDIIDLDITAAERMEGIHAILTAEDIPGENQIGNIIPDEPLLADGVVRYVGQPIAIVVGESIDAARAAARAIVIEYRERPAIFDAREAYAQGQLIVPPRTFSLGDVDKAWRECHVVVEGTAETGGQEHLYLETQGALAYPTEDGGLKLISATQSPKAVQAVIARVLGLAMHRIEIDVPRLGGGFGGKEEQGTPWATMAALAAFRLKRPVKLVLRRGEDMRMTGKRHPYSSDFRIGLTREGKILAYQVTFYQNAGAVADLSPAVLDRTLFHTTNSYFVPNVEATGFSCRTNLPPNTAFRGFGTPQGAFVIESAIFKAAERMDIEPSIIQEKNLLQEGDQLPYGMQVENAQARRCWIEAEKRYRIEKMRQEIQDFNLNHDLQKKGLALMPVCYGISFDKTIFLNQAYALVHAYADGSVSVSTGAVEMGQGVNMKMRQVAARIFSIPPDKIKTESTNTSRVANASPTVSSYSADLNGHAVRLACLNILARLKKFIAGQLNTDRPDDIEVKDGTVYLRGEPTKFTWDKLISGAYFNRINLSAQAHYATPGIHFDEKNNRGKPYAYHVFGTAIIAVTVDCLRGVYRIDSVDVVHDFGKSLNPLIDRGQLEGGIAQGLGWMTTEELNYADDGTLISDGFLTYKVPDIYSAPREIRISFLEDSNNPLGIFNSKAIGEPPLLYGIGAYFAILRAIKAFRPNWQVKFSAPITPEKVLLSFYESSSKHR